MPVNDKPIGILGGTFDPIHLGHLRLAQEVAEALALAEVRFIPGGTPPHRAAPRTPAADRVAMVRLAIADNPLFSLDERETRRAGPSYTCDTLAELRAEVGAARPLVLILGADAFLGFTTWRNWRDVLRLAHIAVAHRPGTALGAPGTMVAELASEFVARRGDARALQSAPAGVIVEVGITALDISSTQVRELVRGKRSTRYLVMPAVQTYIEYKYLFLKEN